MGDEELAAAVVALTDAMHHDLSDAVGGSLGRVVGLSQTLIDPGHLAVWGGPPPSTVGRGGAGGVSRGGT